MTNKSTESNLSLFEESKKRWLSKIKNKTWTALAHEIELDSDTKARKIMTPEYIASWGRCEDSSSQG